MATVMSAASMAGRATGTIPGPVVHVTRYFGLNTLGGVERYVDGLHEHLLQRGTDSTVMWLCGGLGHRGDPERQVFAVGSPASRFEAPDAACRGGFERALTGIRPALAHFHTFGRSEAVCAEILSTGGVPCVFNYHTPSCTCRRGRLLLWGGKLCDGGIEANRCLACKINERSGLPPAAAGAAARLVGLTAGLAKSPAGPWTMHRELEEYGAAFRRFLQGASAVITHGDWVASVLAANGARHSQIKRIEMGADAVFQAAIGTALRRQDGEWVVGYVGRLEPAKGPQLLIEAFKRLKYPRAKLRIIGGDNAKSGSFERRLRKIAAGDSRIEFAGTVAYRQMPSVYDELSLLAVPSLTYETGPFVVREALARGIPVAASPTIGDPGLVRRAGGWLLAENSVRAWSECLADGAGKHQDGTWVSISRPVAVPTAEEMYRDVANVYEECFASAASRRAN